MSIAQTIKTQNSPAINWYLQVNLFKYIRVLVTFENIRDEYGTYTKFFNNSTY